MAERRITHIYKRDGALVPFDQGRITRAIYKAAAEVGEHDLALAEALSDKVVDILEHHFPKETPSVEEIQDIVERVLIEGGHAPIAKAYILYRQKRKELREKREKKKIEYVPYKVVWQTLVWNLDHFCETIENLNRHVKNGTFPALVAASEQRYSDEVENIAIAIEEAKKEGVRVVIIAGPSSSGKTTTTARIEKILKERGIDLVKLTVDNYFYSRELHLQDKYGDIDWEGPEALDLPLINEHLKDLIEGKTIAVPRYNFKTGMREEETDELRVRDDEMVLIDSHYGLYDKLTESVPEGLKFGVYLETLAQQRRPNGSFIEWTDIRMMRRMLRDFHHREYDPIRTVGHWHYVRRGELKNIIPYIENASYIFDTALPYELPILKHHLKDFFPATVEAYRDDPERQDAYIRAERVSKILDEVEEWTGGDSVVPEDSILREFIA
jgi:uridine kinase